MLSKKSIVSNYLQIKISHTSPSGLMMTLRGRNV